MTAFGGAQGLQEAIDAGDVTVQERDGKVVYFWEEIEAGMRNGVATSASTGGRQEISKQVKDMLTGCLSRSLISYFPHPAPT